MKRREKERLGVVKKGGEERLSDGGQGRREKAQWHEKGRRGVGGMKRRGEA